MWTIEDIVAKLYVTISLISIAIVLIFINHKNKTKEKRIAEQESLLKEATNK